MGMYTELHFNAELIRKPPQQVLDVLGYMTGAVETKPPTLPDHALFGTERWEGMLLCSSYYFPLSTASSIDWDDIANSHYLRVRCNLKNHGSEIEKFLNWVMPYVDAGGECLGYYRHEEDPHPTLIYKHETEEQR